MIMMDTFCIHHSLEGILDEDAKLWLTGVVPPIYLSNGEKPAQNPTRLALEQSLTVLDKAKQPTLTFSSGLAAVTTVCLSLLKKDDHAVVVDDAYSGTTHLFKDCFHQWSIQSTFANLSNSASAVLDHLRPETRLVWLESPSNPSLRLVDIETIATLVHKQDPSIVVVVDNTFASPLNQSPLDLGADVCMASLTKYINGHTDVIGGCLSTHRADLYEKFLASRAMFGVNSSPFDCYMVRRGLNTLALRMRQHVHNATQVARFLERHPSIEKVFHPALASHPQHAIYQKQGGASGMCSYVLAKHMNVERFLQELKLCTVAVSLGGCETLIESPALMTHRSTLYHNENEEENENTMSERLIRMSVGLENARDIIADLDRALNQSNQSLAPRDETIWALIEEAQRVSRRLHMPHYQVVASALRTSTGKIYSGIHYESTQGFASVCGEVSALAAMVNDGHRDPTMIVAVRGFDDDKNRFEIMTPCGRCRELIGDFNLNAQVIVGTIDQPTLMNINDLMPMKSALLMSNG